MHNSVISLLDSLILIVVDGEDDEEDAAAAAAADEDDVDDGDVDSELVSSPFLRMFTASLNSIIRALNS